MYELGVFLKNTQSVLFAIVSIFWLYQMAISVFGLFKFRQEPVRIYKHHKIGAIISARNESFVIGNLIDSLKAQNYPKDMLDICVIADNCTDNTADVAREHGAIVYERKDETKKSKGYALSWLFGKFLKEDPNKYDAICIFDADNIVAPDFMQKMNMHLCKGEVIVQGYRDIKNPYDSWISGCYALFYWTMSRFYHLARYNIGLSTLVNGTGFMVKWSLIAENGGWNTKTLTEDIEFSLKSIAGNKKLGWAHDAKVYDEQPIEFAQSWTQRMRWTVGHIQCIKECLPKLFAQTIEKKNMVIADGFFYILGMPLMFMTLSVFLIDYLLIAIGFSEPISLMEFIANAVLWLAISFVLPALSAMLTLKIENKDPKPLLKAILMYPLFLASWMLINLCAFLNVNVSWKPIAHTRSVNISEMNSEELKESETEALEYKI